jgi:uncharacterized membrane protein YgcG
LTHPTISKFRAPRGAAPEAAAGPTRSLVFVAAVIATAAFVAVVATDLIDPSGRIDAAPGSVLGFAADFGLFLALFATGAAVLPAVFDVAQVWERSTPESERRARDEDDGSVFGLLGFDDGDGGCGDGD